MHRSNPTPQPVSQGLEKVVSNAVRRAPPGAGPVLAWPLACGQVVANRTRALDYSAGILRVEVPDAGWQYELRALAARYLATLNRYTSESVTRIEFVIAESR